MNREEIAAYIREPFAMDERAVSDLKRLAETYPWFQTAQLLYAKALSNTNHFDYYNTLKRSSIAAADRQMLYKLITRTRNETVIEQMQNLDQNQTSAIASTQTVVETVIEKQTDIVVTEENENVYVSEIEVALTSNSSVHASVNDYIHTPEEVVEFDNTEDVSEEKEKANKIELVVTPKEVERNLIPPVHNNEIIKEELQRFKLAPLQPATEKNVDELILNPVLNAYIEKEVLGVNDYHKPHTESTKRAEENFDAETGKKILTETLNEPHSFGEWLKLLSTGKATPPLPTTEEKSTAKEEPKTFAETQELRKENQSEELSALVAEINQERERKRQIIDQVIKSNPGPTRITETTQFFSANRTAKASSTEDETLVTETLAWIYEQQGNYPKAIKAYKTLSLKYPEKSVYFASLIQKIKQKQKQK